MTRLLSDAHAAVRGLGKAGGGWPAARRLTRSATLRWAAGAAAPSSEVPSRAR